MIARRTRQNFANQPVGSGLEPTSVVWMPTADQLPRNLPHGPSPKTLGVPDVTEPLLDERRPSLVLEEARSHARERRCCTTGPVDAPACRLYGAATLSRHGTSPQRPYPRLGARGPNHFDAVDVVVRGCPKRPMLIVRWRPPLTYPYSFPSYGRKLHISAFSGWLPPPRIGSSSAMPM